MKQEQMQQAQTLYFQTDLSKNEIASMLGISRRTLHYWAQYHQWERIKKSAAHMPTQLAENCYFIMAKMQEIMLSEGRETPITPHEVSALYKLTLTISKLQKRNTLNETLEMGADFMDFVNRQNHEAADLIKPYMDSYITTCAKGQAMRSASIKKEKPSSETTTEQENREAELDLEDLRYWTENPVPTENTENETTTPASLQHMQTEKNEAIPPSQSKQSMPLPKNTQPLNRAQRRELARTKAAA